MERVNIQLKGTYLPFVILCTVMMLDVKHGQRFKILPTSLQSGLLSHLNASFEMFFFYLAE